jgi:hypothetical protein
MFGELEISDGDSVEDDFQGEDVAFSYLPGYTDEDICEDDPKWGAFKECMPKKNTIRVDHDDEKSGGRKFDKKLREMSFVHERLHAECEDCSVEGILQHLFGPDIHWRQDLISRLRTGLRVNGNSPLQDNEFFAMMEFVCLCFFHHKSPTLLCSGNTAFLFGRSPLMELDRFEELLRALGTTRAASNGDSWELAMDLFEPEVFHAYARVSELFSKLGYSKADSDVTIDDFKYHLRSATFSQMGVARSYHRGSDLGPTSTWLSAPARMSCRLWLSRGRMTP